MVDDTTGRGNIPPGEGVSHLSYTEVAALVDAVAPLCDGISLRPRLNAVDGQGAEAAWIGV